jgi:hypothetical protein
MRPDGQPSHTCASVWSRGSDPWRPTGLFRVASYKGAEREIPAAGGASTSGRRPRGFQTHVPSPVLTRPKP